MTYRGFKDLTRRTVSDKMLRDKAFILLKIQNMMDIKGVSLQWLINVFINKTSSGTIKNKIMSNK